MKKKFLALMGMLAFGANFAFAEALKISGDGAVSGTLDPKTFMGIATVVATLLGVIFAVKAGLRLLRG